MFKPSDHLLPGALSAPSIQQQHQDRGQVAADLDGGRHRWPWSADIDTRHGIDGGGGRCDVAGGSMRCNAGAAAGCAVRPVVRRGRWGATGRESGGAVFAHRRRRGA